MKEHKPVRPSIWDQQTSQLSDPPDAGQSTEPGDDRTERRPGLRQQLRAEWDSHSRAEACYVAIAAAVFAIMLLLALLSAVLAPATP